ncbi:UNVERIFIED_CONTAM: hypothetical protein FKN15_062824 [Acipenser sinensis]
MTQLEAKARRAEIKVAVTMVNHNVPLAVADHFSPLMKECFKDSDVAQRYGAARTKTTCIINRAIAPYLHDELVKKMRNRPYTLSTDGSNDTEFCVFCDTEYMAVIDHVSTRWLSLETAVIHILRLYRALVSYFKSNSHQHPNSPDAQNNTVPLPYLGAAKSKTRNGKKNTSGKEGVAEQGSAFGNTGRDGVKFSSLPSTLHYTIPYSTLHYTPQHPTLHSTAPYTIPHSTLHYILHHPTLHPTAPYTKLYSTAPYTTLYPTAPYTIPYSTLHYTLHYTILYSTLHYTIPYSTLDYTLHYTLQHLTLYPTLHYTLQHPTLHPTAPYTTLYSTLHYTPQHPTLYSTPPYTTPDSTLH